MTANIPIGRVVATEQRPSTPHQFFFWTARDTPVGIGAIVRVEGDGRVVHGVVTDGMAWSDLASALHAVLGADGDPSRGLEPTERADVRVFTASVLRHHPEEPLQPVPLGVVFPAVDADVVQALRMDAFTTGEEPSGIPVGVYGAGGLDAPVYLDANFLRSLPNQMQNLTQLEVLKLRNNFIASLSLDLTPIRNAIRIGPIQRMLVNTAHFLNPSENMALPSSQ